MLTIRRGGRRAERSRAVLAGGIGVAVATVLWAGTAFGCGPQWALRLSPDTAPPGHQIQASGTGFSPGASVNVYFGSPSYGTLVAKAVVGADRAFSASFAVPNVPPGPHLVSAVQTDASGAPGSPVNAVLDVQPAPEPSTTTTTAAPTTTTVAQVAAAEAPPSPAPKTVPAETAPGPAPQLAAGATATTATTSTSRAATQQAALAPARTSARVSPVPATPEPAAVPAPAVDNPAAPSPAGANAEPDGPAEGPQPARELALERSSSTGAGLTPLAPVLLVLLLATAATAGVRAVRRRRAG